MGRSHVTPIEQPDNNTCGPVACKLALEILGIRRSLSTMIRTCKTTRNGTSTKNMIRAFTSHQCAVLVIEYATLHHIQSALKYSASKVRAVLVDYLYDTNSKNQPEKESGHWAVVSAYSASKSRIFVLDSAEGQKKSYNWQDFRRRWMDYDLKRRKSNGEKHQFSLVRHWQPQMLMIVAKDLKHLPKFRISTSKVFLPKN